MNADKKGPMPLICVHLRSSAALFLLCTLICGCGSPNKANIALRKQIQANDELIENLKRQHEADVAQIRGLQGNPSPGVMLPPERLDNLFTTHGIKLGRLTGGADLDENKPGDEGLKVQITPTDDAGDNLKAAGSFVIDAFDLNKSGSDNRVGHWEFNTDEARKNWSS